MDKKLDRIIKSCKQIVDMPYNYCNLDNYIEIFTKTFPTLNISYIPTPEKSPISLMSGNHSKAGILVGIPKSKDKKNIYLVGKDILFDAGGYNLKDEMEFMKDDKSGAIYSFGVASYFNSNVVAYCPTSTNFIHNNKIIPGDIIPIGKHKVEVTNTDAEGRLILAEAISNLNVSKNDIVITVATLTGAVEYAIGSKATGIFGDNKKLVDQYLQASITAKELAWHLPLWKSLQEAYKKEPLRNSIDGEGEVLPGASMGAMFIKQFIKYPDNWLHLDIAGSAFDVKKRKATGDPIKSIIEFIKILNK